MKKMKTFYFFLITSILLVAEISAHAQKDTIVTHSGERYGVTVKGFVENALDRYVDVSPYMNERGQYVTRCPGGLVDRIVFADGFAIRMKDGKVVRDNITEAPRYTGGMTSIQMEGVMPLSSKESRELLGEYAYHLGFVPYKRQARAGLFKTVVGIPVSGWLYFRGLRMNRHGSEDVLDESMNVTGKKEWEEQSPWNTVFLFSASMGVTGLAEMGLANLGISRLATDYKDYSGPSVGSSWRRVAVGAGLVGIGVSMMAYGTVQMDRKGYWCNEWKYLLDGTVTHIDHGEKPGPLWLWSLAGAVLTNLGTAELTYGINCLHGHSALKKAGLGDLSASIGPAPSGYGLTLQF